VTTELLATELKSREPVRSPGRAEPRRRTHPWAWAVTLASVALVAAAAGYLLHDAAQANHRDDRALTSLSTTRRHTADVSQKLAQARADLVLLTRRVGSDTTALSQDTAALQGARAALNAAQAHASQQVTLLSSLHTCLGGVEQALNALAVENQTSAIAALHTVAQTCTAAVAASG
jgi:hypothetical protein